MDPLLGQIIFFAGNFAPRNWAFCDGQLLPIAEYSALYSIMGTTYGGDGRTTFALPDLRGRTAMGQGSNPTGSSYPLGFMGGQETVLLDGSQMPEHSHNIRAKEEGDTDDPNGVYIAGNGQLSFGTTSDVTLNQSTVDSAGGNQPHNNMQPYTILNYIICINGIYPSRS